MTMLKHARRMSAMFEQSGLLTEILILEDLNNASVRGLSGRRFSEMNTQEPSIRSRSKNSPFD